MSNLRIRVHYRGTCECGRVVQSTPVHRASRVDPEAWIRCRACGKITRCEKQSEEPI